jgi:outer membrane receptor protein involved in Fe transport
MFSMNRYPALIVVVVGTPGAGPWKGRHVRRTLQEIPKGRSFQSVIPFAPGARQEPLQSLTNNRLGGFQIDGASNGENVFASDGLNITPVVGGGSGANVPMEFVQDVQVKSSSFEAEFGGALGGVINVIQQRESSNWPLSEETGQGS